MSHVIEQPTAPRTGGASKVKGFFKSVVSTIGHDNPILYREVLSTMRLKSIKGVIIGLPLVLTAIVLVMAAETSRTVGSASQQGAMILGTAISTALYVVGLVGAVLGAQSIAGERQSKTLDLVVATGMSPWRIIAGKAAAVWVVIALLILSCLPPLGIVFVVGGVPLTQMLLAIAIPLAVAIVPISLSLAVGTVQKSAKLAVGAAAATVGLVGPMIFSLLWMSALDVVGVDRAFNDSIFIPTGNVDFWSLLIGGVLMPLFSIIAPAWFLIATAVSSLSSEAGDRAKPLRRWFMVIAPAGGLLLSLIGIVKDVHQQEMAVLMVSILGLLLSLGALALSAHPAPRSTRIVGTKSSFIMSGPIGNAAFTLLVSLIALFPAVALLAAMSGPSVVLWAGGVVLAFMVLVSGSGVLFSSIAKPRLARWAVFGVGMGFAFLPLVLRVLLRMMDPSYFNEMGIAGTFSPIGAMIAIVSAQDCTCISTQIPESSSCNTSPLPGLSIAIWTTLGIVAWQIGAGRLKARALNPNGSSRSH